MYFTTNGSLDLEDVFGWPGVKKRKLESATAGGSIQIPSTACPQLREDLSNLY
jgi:hypothetical protein